MGRPKNIGVHSTGYSLKEGALKFKKVVQIDGHAPDSDHYNLVDGDYIFTVTNTEDNDFEIMKYVQITVSNGTAASYKIADSLEELPSATSQTGGWAVIAGLAEGDYIITEAEERNGLLLSGIQRGDEDTNAVDLDNGTVVVHVTREDMAAEQLNAQATFINNHYNNDGPDRIALDVIKTFEGLVSIDDIPADFRVVISYTVSGISDPIEIELKKNQDETITAGGEHIRIKETTNGFTLSWHITNIPAEASDFKIKETNYGNVTGYTFTEAELDGTDITETAGEWHDMTVVAPTAVLTKVTNERHTPDSEADLRYELQDTDILLSKLTANMGTLIISKESLNSIEREAVRNGWPSQGGFKKPGIFFSIEEHPEGFSFGGKTITFSEENGKTYVTFTSSAAAQEDVFAVSYDSHTSMNNAALKNVYLQQKVALDLIKVSQDDADTKLSGAQFTIRKIKDTLGANGIEYDGDESEPVTTGANGDAQFENITQGYYEIREKKTPDGYIITGEGCFYIKVNNGVIYLLEKTAGTDPKAWDATKTVVGNVTFTAASETTNAVVQVGNTPGAALPHTGGPGTRLFTILGAFLIAGAALLLWKRRRET